MTAIAAADVLPIVGAAESPQGGLVVSVHDVAPATHTECRHIIEELTRLGIRRTSLLVVPDYHELGKTTSDAQFVRWLRELESDGHEIVIHGYFHQRQKRSRETVRDAFITRLYTEGEGEFYDLSYVEALRRIVAARDEFRSAGFNPRGFIAPAWLLNGEGEAAARDAEMEYTTRLTTVLDLRSGARFDSRSLVYSTRTALRRNASRVWNAGVARAISGGALARLSIHPPDPRFSAVWRQITAFAADLAETRTPTTYGDWISDQRTAAESES